MFLCRLLLRLCRPSAFLFRLLLCLCHLLLCLCHLLLRDFGYLILNQNQVTVSIVKPQPRAGSGRGFSPQPAFPDAQL